MYYSHADFPFPSKDTIFKPPKNFYLSVSPSLSLCMTMAASSCSHWWHAPIYFTLSVILAIIAITTPLHSNRNTSIQTSTESTRPIFSHELTLNASKALRKSGFNIMATLLQLSPDLFFSSPEGTLFAIDDSAISNVSVPPLLVKELIQYHISSSNLPFNDLLRKPQGSCISTLLHHRNVAITKTQLKERLIEINGVSISHPDIFLEESISIHGVLGPFSPLDYYIQSPVCDSNSMVENNNTINWKRIITSLSSNGFVPFAIGLQYVLDGILQDFKNLTSVTIFAPLELPFIASSSPLLDRVVRFQILPQRFTFAELEVLALHEKTHLTTLIADREIKITKRSNSSEALTVNEVQIAAADMFLSKNYAIHGVSRAFDMTALSNHV